MVNISARECFGYPYVYGHLGLAVPQGFSDFIPFPPNPNRQASHRPVARIRALHLPIFKESARNEAAVTAITLSLLAFRHNEIDVASTIAPEPSR
jgi:hypothetical protein